MDLNPGVRKVLEHAWDDTTSVVEVCPQGIKEDNQLTKGTELAVTQIPTYAKGAIELANSALRNKGQSQTRNLWRAKQSIEGMASATGFDQQPLIRKKQLPPPLFSNIPEREATYLANRKKTMNRYGKFLEMAAGASPLTNNDHALAQELSRESTNTGVEGYEPPLSSFPLLHSKETQSREKTVHLARQAQPSKKLVPGNSWSPRLD